ncbi:MAG: hypothetical protein R2827_12335 [Bdellovibrionales bacterium]
MKFKSKTLMYAVVLLAPILFFQNCSDVEFGQIESSVLAPQGDPVDIAGQVPL